MTTYESSGVSIEAGDRAVELIKPHVASTSRPGVAGELGGFGGLFDLAAAGYDDPVLVSGTDGVGTKIAVAIETDRLETIGIDLVAMCVDDLVCQGAEPLFFLDYLSVGRLSPERVERLVSGIADGCRQAGCALIGGEMAEHRGLMADDDVELVGFAVGAVERSRVVTGERVGAGDVLIGIPSPNLRSNGFSLARRVFFEIAARSVDDPAWEGADHSVADELLAPSVIYAPAVLAALEVADVHAIAHVTGGGLSGNLARVLPADVSVSVDRSSWEQPRVFTEIQRLGGIDSAEMERVFNLGIGMVLVVAAVDAGAAQRALESAGHRAAVIGETAPGPGTITYT